MAHVKKVKVALNLAEMTIPQKIEKGRHIVTEMTGNSNFGGDAGTITPPLAEISTAVDELETAHDKAQGGGTAQTAIQHEKETVLDNKLTQLGHYVEDVANDNPETAESIALSAGMEVKHESESVGELAAPENFSAKNGANEGDMKLNCNKVDGASAYIWLACLDPIDPASWFMMEDHKSLSTASRFTWEGLTPGLKYHFKVAAIGAAGRGPWSDTASHWAT